MKRIIVFLLLVTMLFSCSKTSDASKPAEAPREEQANNIICLESPGDKTLPDSGLTPEQFRDSVFTAEIWENGEVYIPVLNKTDVEIDEFMMILRSSDFEDGIKPFFLNSSLKPGELLYIHDTLKNIPDDIAIEAIAFSYDEIALQKIYP
ncbi:MAG: hypothetical protein GX260_04805 [Tissierellia bacterium]|nr:hypothetical protein [Bacillota bacterium]NLL23081.1 hypothetical protein [Tissierellia bacterium]